MAAGYSRVLVYEGEDTRNIRGYLQVLYSLIVDTRPSFGAVVDLEVPGVSQAGNGVLAQQAFVLRTGYSYVTTGQVAPTNPNEFRVTV